MNIKILFLFALSCTSAITFAQSTFPPTGNVGIGTSNPTAALHINPIFDESSIKIGVPYSPGNINVPLGASPGSYNIDFYTWRDMQPDQIGARIRAERVNTFQPSNALVQGMDLVFQTSIAWEQTDLKERLRITNDGRVGIGVSDPKGSMLAVNGNIRAREIKVETTNWPDYVFEKDYKQHTLADIETFIKENKHLPEIPSAAEIEANGVELGDLSAKMLKKIEELTLLLIEKDKELRSEKDILNKQQQQIEELAERLNKLEDKR